MRYRRACGFWMGVGGALVLALAARGQVGNQQPAAVPQRQQIVVINGGNGAQQVNVVVGPGGQLIIVPMDTAGAGQELPIVSDGFANDRDIKGPIAPLVKALEAASYQDREDASEALLRLPPGRLPEVVEALKKETDEEAVARLTDAAAHLFLKPRTYLKARTSLLGVLSSQHEPSLLGIRFQPEVVKLQADASEVMTVLVTEIQPGFPAMQTLRAGDRIVAINGVGFPTDMPDTGFRMRIAELWPGSVVPMLVWRDGKMLELGVQTSGLPQNVAAMPEMLMNQRIAGLAAFLQSLQKPEKSEQVQ